MPTLRAVLERSAILLLPLSAVAHTPVVRPVPAPSRVAVVGLRAEYLTDPVEQAEMHPRLRWRIASGVRNTVQSDYAVQVATSEAALAHGVHLVWDSGKLKSDASVFVNDAGPAPASATRYYWRVRVWTAAGDVSAWSPAAYWETGLLRATDWTAKWIGPAPQPGDSGVTPLPLLRREFELHGRVRSARLYVTSLGLNQGYLNGRRVGRAELTPGWTSYHHRLEYLTYDVTALLRAGDNAVGAMLGDGWYRGYLGFDHARNLYGEHRALLLQLDVRFDDGRTERIASDGKWKTIDGPVRSSDIYNGETYDARLERTGWTSAPYDDGSWASVAVLDAPAAQLVAPVAPPVRRVRELKPVAIRTAPNGEIVFDLGQNFVEREIC